MTGEKSLKPIRPPVKTHGGKWYLKYWVIDNFPPNYEHLTYIETFIGGGSVLLNKRPSQQEIIADKDSKIISLWKSLRYNSSELIAELEKVNYSIDSFQIAQTLINSPDIQMKDLETAIAEFVVRRMSRGGLRNSFAWSERLRGGKPGDLNAWETSIENLWDVSKRVQDVQMWCLDFRTVLKNWNDKDVLFYLDPPYLKSTRAKGATSAYEFEMSDSDHEEMLDLCLKSKAKILISGYSSPLYTEKLKNWNAVFKHVANNASQAKVKKVKQEMLWRNY